MELNDLELNEEKLSLMVIGTSPMSKKNNASLIYYTFELDLLFKVRLQSDPHQSSYEVALQNYRLMKEQASQGKPVKITAAEESVVKLLVDRADMGKRLKPSVIRARRAFFTLRNMLRVQYRPMSVPYMES